MAKNEAKVKFTADASQFNDQIKESEQNLKVLRAQLKENSSEMKANGESQDGMKQRLSILNQEMELTKQKTEATSQKLDLAKSIFGENSNEAKNLEAALSRCKNAENVIQADINKTNESLQKQQDSSMQASSALGQLEDTISRQEQEVSRLESEYKNAVIQYGKTSTEAQKLKNEFLQVGQQLQESKNKMQEADHAAGELSQALSDIGDGANDAKNDLQSIADAAGSGALLDTADTLEGAADKIKEIGNASYETYADIENATTKVTSYFGETGKAADQSASVIKEIYESGFGDSIDSVGDAVLNVKKQLGDLDNTTLSNITQQAMILEDSYGIDMNESLRGVNSLMQHFGMDAQTAMDYLVAGTQNGLDKTDELGDNLSEYSGKFAEAGYSADEYFQLLQNGLDGGAYNLDKVNDAINEVTTRLGDGTIGDSIGQYSTKTQELFQAWQNGKGSQKDVIDSIVNDINKAKTQQEKMNLASTAFGTLAEDGGIKVISSLTSVGNAYDNVSGKANKLNDATTTPMQQLEGNVRKVKDAFAPFGEQLAQIGNTVLPPLASGITGLSNVFSSLPQPVKTVVTALGTAIAVVAGAIPVIMTVKGILLGLKAIGLAGSIASLASPIGIAIAAITAIIAVGTLLTQNWDKIKTATSNLKKSIATSWNNMKSSIGNTCTNIANGARTKFTAMRTNVSTIFTGIRTNAGTIWNGTRAKIATAVQNTASNTKSKFTSMASSAVTTFSNIRSRATSIFNGVKYAITHPVETAKNAVNRTVRSIRGFFTNLRLKIPTPSLPRLPHFSLKMGSKKILGKTISYPTGFGVQWYAKAMNEPVILNSPTIFGTSGNKFLGGGEAGSEVVAGTQTLMNMIKNAVMSVTGIDLDALATKIAEACARQNIIVKVDKRELGRLIKEI